MKFRARYIGPYNIIEKISSQAYKLDLPLSMKVHPVFRIGLLKYFISSSRNQKCRIIFLLLMILFMVTILVSFTQLLITELPHTLLLTRKVQPYYLKTNGKDMTLPKTLGNLIYVNVKLIVCMTILNTVINSDFLLCLVNTRS